MALSLKQKLFDYFAQRHINLMTPEIRARFDEYDKNEDFQGHMKEWKKRFIDKDNIDLLNGTVGGITNEHELTPAEWEELYDAFQAAFQEMDRKKTPSVGFASPYKKATLDFIAKWFGDSSSVFTTTTAKTGPGSATDILSKLKDFLDDRTVTPQAPQSPYSALKQFLTNSPELKDSVFSDGLDYDGFINGLNSQKYNTDLKFRNKVERVIYYIQRYGPRKDGSVPSPSAWPQGIGYTYSGTGMWSQVDSVIPVLDTIYSADTEAWYEMANKSRHIQQFKADFSQIFDKLLTSSGVRNDFLAEENSGKISKPLNEAIQSTDYSNKDSKDFLPEKYKDEKNWLQELEDWKNDTYEEYFRKFTNPSRGTRIFFSPWSQNIAKAFDKVKLKPTDGLKGILDKKNDILGKLKSSKTSYDHFEWFANTIEKLKNQGMDKAFEGALRNGAQMRHLVSGLIAEAVKNGKVKEAKTALEILSVAKYGLSSSRTMDAINKTDVNVFSDGKLSWNKNEGIQTVTKAVDKTIKTGIQAAGYIATGAYNFIQHRRTKIGNDLSNNNVLNKAYKQWQTEDTKKLNDLRASNAMLNVDNELHNLATGSGRSGYVIANDADKTAAESALATMTPGTPSYDDLKADLDLYTDYKKRKDAEINWRDNNKDNFKELIAYWDMLESVGKTHAFTLGSIKVKRDAHLKDFVNGNSPAHDKFKQYLAQYGNIRAA